MPPSRRGCARRRLRRRRAPGSTDRAPRSCRCEHCRMATSPEDRPPVATDYHTEDLPPLPQRDYLIPAERWVEAPPELRELGADFGVTLVAYKRRIGRYLLWR